VLVVNAFRIVRDCLIILACLCVIVLTAEAFYVQAKIGQVVSNLEQQVGPTDQPTGCPVGSLDCGG
jgi:hypothetical protein